MEVTWQVHYNIDVLIHTYRCIPTIVLNKMEALFVTLDQVDLHTMLTDLLLFTRYTFKVSAVNAAEAGPFSVAVEGTTEEDGEC